MSLLCRARRVCSLAGAALLCACSGGWTGEITEPSACEHVAGTRALSELGAEDAALLAAAEAPVSARLVWELDGAGETEVVTSVRATGDADVMGGEGCDRPWLRVPVELRVETSDGRLDEALFGTIALRGAASASVSASGPVSALRGDLAIDGEGVLRAALSVGEGTPHGEVYFAPAAGDEELLASW